MARDWKIIYFRVTDLTPASVLDDDDAQTIYNTLKRWCSMVAGERNKWKVPGATGDTARDYKFAEVTIIYPSWGEAETYGPYDVRCFILPEKSAKWSRVLRLGGSRLGPAGTTWQSPKGTVSEVYANVVRGDAEIVSKLVFHEFMHNKSRMGNEMHSEAGFGLGAEEVEFSTPTSRSTADLNWENIKFMSEHMLNVVPQYKGP